MAGVLVVAAVALVGYLVGKGTPPPTVASMGNAGNAGARSAQPRAPDISNMSPRERFDRLFQRIAESQSSDTIMMFAPMALGAYQQLDQVDTDLRFHAATIHLIVGETSQALALADTIAATQANHLFASLIRGEAAQQQGDSVGLAKQYAAFLATYDAELKVGRREYLEHRPWLDEFRARAESSANAQPGRE